MKPLMIESDGCQHYKENEELSYKDQRGNQILKAQNYNVIRIKNDDWISKSTLDGKKALLKTLIES